MGTHKKVLSESYLMNPKISGYQHDRVSMVVEYLCILAHGTKEASELEGFYFIMFYLIFLERVNTILHVSTAQNAG